VEPRRHQLEANGVGLSVLELGPAEAVPLVMLHGMRDVAWSLMPLAEALSRQHRVLLLELRGHGTSDQPGCYGIEHFLFDLHQVFAQLEIGPAALLGHSLGGQIGARFAALFPDLVRAAVLVEGLGPPDRPGEGKGEAAAEIAAHGAHLLQVLGTPAQQRPLPGVGFAAERLMANNPRLEPARAQALAERATRRDQRGELVWAFDPRVRSVFLSVRRDDTERYWRCVRCPVLIVSGGLADEYWRAQMPVEWDGRFAPGELQSRVRCFADAEHVTFHDAGHMVHYDRPAALTEAVAEFLGRRL
jgi:pimeloyl-ACP methyl ester carboxylesterase